MKYSISATITWIPNFIADNTLPIKESIKESIQTVLRDLHGQFVPKENCTEDYPKYSDWREPDFRVPTWESLMSNLSHILNGGRWSPRHCQPQHRVAILVPYRERPDQLRVFLRHIHNFLPKQLIDYTVFVIEQDNIAQFNRGTLLNIGAIHALRRNFTCLVFHDVDYLAISDYVSYHCPLTPTHIATSVDSKGWKLLYPNHFGGVSAMSSDHFQLVNGYSNIYFGWGSEDDDISGRIRDVRLTLDQRPYEQGKYRTIPHVHAVRNKQRWGYFYSARERYTIDGLNSVLFKLLRFEEGMLYTWIHVSINNTDVIHNYNENRKKLTHGPSPIDIAKRALSDDDTTKAWVNLV